jgi:hypothetical protein
MKNPLSALSRRQKVVLLIIGCVFLICIAAILMHKDDPQSGQETTLVSPTAVPQIVQQVIPVPSGTIDKATKWQTYSSNDFSFQYPPEWSVKTDSLTSGGSILTVRPNVLPAGINYPQFTLQRYPLTDATSGTNGSILQGLGLIESDAHIGALPAKQYKGTLPFKVVADQTLKEPVQDTTYIVVKDSTQYVLKYEYEGNQLSDMLEDFFSGFINSFKAGQ